MSCRGRDRPSYWMALAVVMWAGVACEAMAQISPRPQFVEDEIGGIHIGQDQSDQVIRLYGPAIKVPGVGTPRAAERLCYWDESRQVGVEFRTTEFEDVVAMVIVVTTSDQLPRVCRLLPIKLNRPVTTGKMIGPGDAVEKVLSVYGEPRHRREEDVRGRKWIFVEYEAQHERRPGVKRWYWAGLAFLDGKLASLVISETEESMSKIMRGE